MDYLISFLSGILGGVGGGILLLRFRRLNSKRTGAATPRGPRVHKDVASFNAFLEKNAEVRE